jgi:hypothetical protein
MQFLILYSGFISYVPNEVKKIDTKKLGDVLVIFCFMIKQTLLIYVNWKHLEEKDVDNQGAYIFARYIHREVKLGRSSLINCLCQSDIKDTMSDILTTFSGGMMLNANL